MARLLTLLWPKYGQVIDPTAYIYIYIGWAMFRLKMQLGAGGRHFLTKKDKKEISGKSNGGVFRRGVLAISGIRFRGKLLLRYPASEACLWIAIGHSYRKK